MRPAAALLALLVAPAFAVDIPQETPRDHRIQRVNYHPDDVVRVELSAGQISRIILEPGESIIEAHPGFPEAWSAEPAGHILYIRPLSIPGGGDEPSKQPEPGVWDTNLVITTNRRLYDIDLRLVAPENAHDAFYRIEFQYPAAQRKQARAKREADKNREALERVVERLPAARNADYTMALGSSSSMIAPALAYDDGRFTYLQFPGNVEMPSVFVVGADGTEGVVKPRIDTARDDVLVVDRVVEQLVLRLGSAVVSIFNDSFDPHGSPPVNGTTVPGLERTTVPNWSQFDEMQGHGQ